MTASDLQEAEAAFDLADLNYLVFVGEFPRAKAAWKDANVRLALEDMMGEPRDIERAADAEHQASLEVRRVVRGIRETKRLRQACEERLRSLARAGDGE